MAALVVSGKNRYNDTQDKKWSIFRAELDLISVSFLSGRWIMPQPRKSQISLIDTPYFIHNIHVVHFFEAS